MTFQATSFPRVDSAPESTPDEPAMVAVQASPDGVYLITDLT